MPDAQRWRLMVGPQGDAWPLAEDDDLSDMSDGYHVVDVVSAEVTDEMVESVMNDLCAGQVAVIRSLKAETQEGYMRAMRGVTRRALERALPPRETGDTK